MLFGGFLTSLLTLVAVAWGWTARRRIRELKDRLARVETRLDEIGQELRWQRAERQGDANKSEGPVFGPDQGLVRPAVIKAETPPEGKRTSVPPISPTDASPQPAAAEPSQQSVPPIAGATSATNGTNDEPKSFPKTESLEERLGTRWAVWAGGAALALGGLFLVRYSIDAGLVGPGVRVALGALLAAALVAAGEAMRRNGVPSAINALDALPQAHIPSVLTAAGTTVAFGTIYASHALYGFIGAGPAFLLLGATGVATMLAAALHGPWLAGLGLAGAFCAPLLVSSETPNMFPLVLYLAVVAASAYMLARVRTWLWLATATVAGAVFWGLAIAPTGSDVEGGVLLSNAAAVVLHAIVQLALGVLFLAYEPHAGVRDDTAAPDPIALGALGALTLLPVSALASLPFAFWGWLPLAALAIACLTAIAVLRAPAAGAGLLSGLVTLTALIAWPTLNLPVDPTLTAPDAETLLRLPAHVSSFLTFAALATLIPAAVSALRIWRGSLLPTTTAALYATAATLPPLVALVAAYLRVTLFDTSIPFAAAGVLLAGGFAIAAQRFDAADDAYGVAAYKVTTGIFAAAALAAFAFALVASLSRGYLTVALALAGLGAAFVANRRDIPLLRHAVSAIGLIVLARVLWNPRIMGDDVGTTPIFNWLLVGYGVPAVAFAVAARLLARRGEDISVRIADSLAVVLTGLLAFFEIRHLTTGGDVFQLRTGHVEVGLITFVSLLSSYVLARLNLGRQNVVFDIASTVHGALALAFALVGLGVVVNPLFSGDPVAGAVLLSSLATGYLLPGLAALFLSRHARSARPLWFTRAAGILAVTLIFLYVSLEVRHAFQGQMIGIGLETSDAESWAYSAAWLALGIVLLGYGLLRGSLEARIASAALILLAALKVTLFDLAGIGGLWRALSFLCFGAVLIGIGLVYQKIIFARPAPQEPPVRT